MSRTLARALPLLPLLVACGSPPLVHGTRRAIGADAVIQVERIEGGNQLVTVQVRHLPPPERLAPGATRFVMWFVRSGHPATMASELHYDSGSRQGRARATIPHRGFQVIITAERAGVVSVPSEHVVFRDRPRQ
ncbi:MAG: hypothetical protein RLO52_37015 [Sandaracinaceae bacterium]